MTIGFIFWLLILLTLIFGFYWHWPGRDPGPFGSVGGNLLLFILIILLGLATFGWPIKG